MELVRIEHLDDVTPHVSFEKGFVVSRRPEFTVVDYVYTTDDTFDSPVARECRGLKFDANGRIIGRPFHKFFNVGEKEDIRQVDWDAPHTVLDKLDGSMVHPVELNGEIVFMTRMGDMPQAGLAAGHADDGILDLCRTLLGEGVTPIFEFTAPDNRIVVEYDEPRLTLLAAREMISGAYWKHDELERIGSKFGAPIVDSMGPLNDPLGFVDEARGFEGIEGYVIAFESGHRIKLKTDAYVLRHKVLSGLGHEKTVLALVAENAVDDIVHLLPPKAIDRLMDYRATVLDGLERQAAALGGFVEDGRDLPRKEFALLVSQKIDARLRGAAFKMLDGVEPREALLDVLLKAARSDTRVEGVRDLFGMQWDTTDLGIAEFDT